MLQSQVVFGTSGARGLVVAMTDQICYGYTTGFLKYLMEDGAWGVGQRVALSGDLRASTPRILSACAEAVRDLGGKPVFCGYVPTPAMAHWSFSEGVPSIMVTGSHIPDDRNGIKFYRPDGEILKEDEPRITRQFVTIIKGRWSPNGHFVSPPMPIGSPNKDVGKRYLARYVEAFGREALRGKKIGVYQHSAVGRDLLVDILGALGATVVPLGRSKIFVPVDTEAVRPEDVLLARKWVVEHQLDAIASTDGDSDRPLLADDTGEWLRGDVLGMLCARELNADVVVTPISSNTLVEKCASFVRVLRTKIGSPFVIAAMNEALIAHGGVVCGYEANGGFLLGSDIVLQGKLIKALPTRDAILPIVTVLANSRNEDISQLLSQLPQRHTVSDRLQGFLSDRRDHLMGWLRPEDTVKRNVQVEEIFAPIARSSLTMISFLDGARMTFANDRVIHLRASGNAPELRCYTEAESCDLATELNRATLAAVAELFP